MRFVSSALLRWWFRWLAAYEAAGLPGLVPRRRGPRRPRSVHPLWVELVVSTVRLLTYWNAKRIAAELRRREIALVSPAWIVSKTIRNYT